ncbi:MAG: LCP family protein [Eubacteriales bacterium]
MAKKNDLGATAEFRIKRKKKKGLAGWQKFLIAVAAVLCIIVLAVLGVFTYFKYIHKPISGMSGLSPVSQPNTADSVNGDALAVPDDISVVSDRYNFLVVGCDRAEWLSDVIMIATYDVKEKSLSIMQIPRDTYVTVNNKLILDENGAISFENFDGKNDYGCKINSVLGHGGNLAASELSRIVSLASGASNTEIDTICKESFLDIDSKTLSAYMNAATRAEKSAMEYDIKLKFGIRYLSALLARSFGTPIDFYAQVNLDGFVNIVDAIGGVDVYVQQDMDYDDPYQNLHIHIKQGQQHLNGKDAEGFIRFRYGYAAADIARIDAQKIFMTAFIKKVLSLEGIMNLNDLSKQVSANLTTNLSFSDALYFATNALDLDLSKVVMLTMPGSPKYLDGVSYYSIDKKTMMEYVNTYLNKFSEPLGEENFYAVEIAAGNTSTPPLTAADITEQQPNLGFLRPSSGSGSSAAQSAPSPSETSENRDGNSDPETADSDRDTGSDIEPETESVPEEESPSDADAALVEETAVTDTFTLEEDAA